MKFFQILKGIPRCVIIFWSLCFKFGANLLEWYLVNISNVDFNSFQASVSCLCPLKFLKNLWLSNDLRGYRQGEFVEMGLAYFVCKIRMSPHKLILFEVNKKITRLTLS